MKICPEHGDQFMFYKKTHRSYQCRKCASRRIKEWRWKQREIALAHYGGQCSCCGETTPVFLAFDHIDGGGNAHRKAEKITGGNSLAIWIVRNGFPTNFQILCHNCNFAKHHLGQCPHEKED